MPTNCCYTWNYNSSSSFLKTFENYLFIFYTGLFYNYCLKTVHFITVHYFSSLCTITVHMCLQCFDTVGWATGRASACKKTEWWGAGMVICLERGADLHMA